MYSKSWKLKLIIRFKSWYNTLEFQKNFKNNYFYYVMNVKVYKKIFNQFKVLKKLKIIIDNKIWVVIPPGKVL